MKKRIAPNPEDYPNLFQRTAWGLVQAQFELRETPPAAAIGNVNLVPFVGEQVVMLRFADGAWEIPGGTVEPDEPYLGTLCRELLEEAGAQLLSFEPFGAWRCHSTAAAPYRAHLPRPDFYRLAGYGQVALVAEPRPSAAEPVVRVERVSIEAAARRFRASNRPDLADLYRLANQLRQRE